jgi:hypothetical protein
VPGPDTGDPSFGAIFGAGSLLARGINSLVGATGRGLTDSQVARAEAAGATWTPPPHPDRRPAGTNQGYWTYQGQVVSNREIQRIAARWQPPPAHVPATVPDQPVHVPVSQVPSSYLAFLNLPGGGLARPKPRTKPKAPPRRKVKPKPKPKRRTPQKPKLPRWLPGLPGSPAPKAAPPRIPDSQWDQRMSESRKRWPGSLPGEKFKVPKPPKPPKVAAPAALPPAPATSTRGLPTTYRPGGRPSVESVPGITIEPSQIVIARPQRWPATKPSLMQRARALAPKALALYQLSSMLAPPGRKAQRVGKIVPLVGPPLTDYSRAELPFAQYLGTPTATATKTKRCDCKRKKGKPKKPRTICYSGSYTETRKGLNKRKRTRIPCK